MALEVEHMTQGALASNQLWWQRQQAHLLVPHIHQNEKSIKIMKLKTLHKNIERARTFKWGNENAV
jgi:hypothetical protein